MLKKNIYLIIIFIAVSFFSSTTIYLIQKNIAINSFNNDFLNFDAINFRINVNGDENLKNHLTNINDDYLLLTKEDANMARAIYLKGKLKRIPPIVKGRFFNENDFCKGNKFIVIGKELQGNIEKKNGENYYYLNNDYYKVIGVIGDSKEESYYDYRIYYNLDYYMKKDSTIMTDDMTIDAAANTKKIFSNIVSQYKNDDITVNELPPRYESPLSDKLKNSYKEIVADMLKVIALLVINILLITSYWIKKRIKEIAIKRSMGATRVRISLEILLELSLTSILSFVAGYVIFLAVTYAADGYVHLYFATMICVFLITFFSGLISAIVPIIKAVKVQPAEMMR